MAPTFRFASWNVNNPSAARLARQLALLHELECDVVALQEISAAACNEITRSEIFEWSWSSCSLRPRTPDETTSRDRGCALLASARFEPVSEPTILLDAAAPERSLAIRLARDGIELDVASFYQVAAADSKWGPAKKAQTFRAIAAWLREHPKRAAAGMDVNSPDMDHPDVEKNGYFWSARLDDQDEHLLHDPARAPHVLEDAYRVHLRAQPEKLERIRELRPSGPVAISHLTRGNPHRFDFIYITPDLRPAEVRYRKDVMTTSEGVQKLSDHALVVADLELQSLDPTA
jgi:exonuclease III